MSSPRQRGFSGPLPAPRLGLTVFTSPCRRSRVSCIRHRPCTILPVRSQPGTLHRLITLLVCTETPRPGEGQRRCIRTEVNNARARSGCAKLLRVLRVWSTCEDRTDRFAGTKSPISLARSSSPGTASGARTCEQIPPCRGPPDSVVGSGLTTSKARYELREGIQAPGGSRTQGCELAFYVA